MPTACAGPSMALPGALAALDIAVAACVAGVLVNSPLASPAIGDCYVVGPSPQGAWTGHALALAGFTSGGWRFVEAREGLSAVSTQTGEPVVYRSGGWTVGQLRASTVSVSGDQVIGPRLPAVSDPAGGTTIDSEARAAISAILARLRLHGLIAS